MFEDQIPCTKQESYEDDARQESAAQSTFNEEIINNSRDSFGDFYDDIGNNLKKRKKKIQGLTRRQRNKNNDGRRRKEEINEITGK